MKCGHPMACFAASDRTKPVCVSSTRVMSRGLRRSRAGASRRAASPHFPLRPSNFNEIRPIDADEMPAHGDLSGSRRMKGWLLVGPEANRTAPGFQAWIAFALPHVAKTPKRSRRPAKRRSPRG
jgi:hypothetical protein